MVTAVLTSELLEQGFQETDQKWPGLWSSTGESTRRGGCQAERGCRCRPGITSSFPCPCSCMGADLEKGLSPFPDRRVECPAWSQPCSQCSAAECREDSKPLNTVLTPSLEAHAPEEEWCRLSWCRLCPFVSLVRGRGTWLCFCEFLSSQRIKILLAALSHHRHHQRALRFSSFLTSRDHEGCAA